MKFEAAPVLLSTFSLDPLAMLALLVIAAAGLAIMLGARREATLFAAVVGALVLVLSR